MPGHSSAQAIYTRILFRTRARTALVKRHQSTFSFFSRNQDSITPALSGNPSVLKSDKSVLSPSGPPSRPGALKISPSYANAAPLLQAIQNKDQDTAWMVYSVLSRAGQLSSLLPIHHSILLRSIRPSVSYRYSKADKATLVERHEQVWAGMIQCHIQPDMNDYTARLELLVATRQHQLLDLTWTEMRGKAGSSFVYGGMNGVASVGAGAVPLIQPTLYTYNLILQSCVPRKNIGLAMETITLMRRAGIKPDNMSWDYVLQIHTAMKNWKAVEATFKSVFHTASIGIEQRGQNMSAPAYMTVPLGQRARTLHGGAILPNNKNGNTNSKEKLIPTLQNTHTLFSYYAYTQDLEDLRSMFDSHVRLFGLVPTTRTYNEMIKFAFLARRGDEAFDLFRELVKVGQNLDKVQAQKNSIDSPSSSVSDAQTEGSGQHSESSSSTQPKIQACGPDFSTFQIMFNNELIASKNRWGRAWKWIKIMQEAYGLEPSDSMFRRTIASMKRLSRNANESDIQKVQSNWDQVRARREGAKSGTTSPSLTPSPSEGDVEELSQATSSS
ncbi:hypothetical protein BGX27_001481 [Mortierella sp. AM989]|nr:hypothetical protein BGX27_001481 [Mortierella sp. AM989]